MTSYRDSSSRTRTKKGIRDFLREAEGHLYFRATVTTLCASIISHMEAGDSFVSSVRVIPTSELR